MADYGRTTVGASFVDIEVDLQGTLITLPGGEAISSTQARLRSTAGQTGDVKAALVDSTTGAVAYESNQFTFSDATDAWRTITWPATTPAAGTYYLTIGGGPIAGGGNTVEIAFDTVAASTNFRRAGSSLAGAQSTYPAFPATVAWDAADDTHDVSLYLVTSGGGTVNTQTLLSTVVLSDVGLASKTSGRLGADTVSVDDAGLDYVFFSRLGSDSVTVTDDPLEFYNVYGISAISEIVVGDELVLWLRRNRLLEDNILVTDQLISTVIAYLIFISTLTSNVTVTDQALKAAQFYRLAESNVITADQLLTALLIARNLLDGVEVTDSSLTSTQRFILLTDAISLEDSLSALYIPVTGPATDNPIIRIGFDQPQVMLGGYSVN